MEILGPLVVTGKITANAVAVETTSMEGLFLSASGDLTKRALGTMALQSASNYLTSVGLNLPGIFNITNPTATPANSTLTAALANQTANTVFAGPNGASGTPIFRALVAEDIPTIAISKVSGLQTALDTKLSGYGTVNYLAKYTGVAGLGNSQIFDNGTNVAIGHTSPATKLDIDGTLTLRNGSVVTSSMAGGVSVNGTARSFVFNYNSSTTNEGFLFRNINAGTNLMFLRADGNVGVGNIAPAYKIDVTGTGRFTGDVIFDTNAIVATAPTSGNHLTNKTYVDGKTWDILNINGLQAAIDNKWTLGGNALASTGYFGSTTNQDINFIRNGIAGLTLTSTGVTALKGLAVGRLSGQSGGWDSLAVFGGNVTIGGRNSPAQGSYDLNFAAYTLLDNANNVSRKARMKFGYYDAVNFVDKFNRTIEYWRSDSSIVVGSHTSAIGNLDTSAPVEANSIYIASDGATSIGQQDKEGYKFLVNGSVRFKSTLDVTTSITTPLIIGGTGAASGLVYKATSGVGTSSYHSFVVGNNGAVEALRIDNSGNVGIGTASPAYKFDVNGTGHFAGNVTFDANAILSTAPTSGSHLTNKTYVDAKIAGTTNYVVKFTSASAIGNSQIFDNGANVAIGHAVPTTKLDIDGTLTLRSGAIVTSSLVGGVDVNGLARSFRFIYNSSSTTEGFNFWNANSSTNLMHIQGNGNVIIGGTTTTYKLDVNGTGRFTGIVQFDAIPSCAINATTGSHLVNLSTLMAYTSGIKYDTVKVRTVAMSNITLSGHQTISGYTTSGSDRVLVMGQTTASQNGVYISGSGAWTRDTNFDTDTEIRGAIHSIQSGTYAGYKYINANTSAITVGTTAIVYTEFSSLVETDPVFTASAAYNVTSTKISNWDTAFSWGNHASAGYGLASSISGTTNRLAKFTSAGAVGNSQIFDDGTNVAIGHTSPATKLDIDGTLTLRNGSVVTSSMAGGVSVNGTARSFVFNYNSSTTNEGFLFKNTNAGTNLMFLRADGNVGIGNIAPAYKFDVSGTGRFTADVLFGADINITGKIKLNGSTGVDHQFIKFNGTNTEWAYMNTGELQDKNDIVMLGNYAGERGFQLYSDAAKTCAEGIVFTNPDTGVIGLHGYKYDGEVREYGINIDRDGLLYHRKLNKTRARILTTDDILTGGGGTVYTGANPIIVNNTTISIATASATQTGALSAADWNAFNSKIGDGSTLQYGLTLKSKTYTSSPSVLPALFLAREHDNVLDATNVGSILYSPSNAYSEKNIAISGQGSLGVAVSADSGNIRVKTVSGKLYIQDKEIDFSGFATGKVLKATSSTKAEWVNP